MTKLKEAIKNPLLQFNEVETDKGLLTWSEDELAVGIQVYVDNLPAPDGEYKTADNVVLVANGVVTEIKPIEVEAEPEVETIPVKAEEVEAEPANDIVAELEAKANPGVAESASKAAKSVNLLSGFKKLISPTGIAIAAVAVVMAVLVVTKIKKLKEDLDVVIELNKTTAGAAEQIVNLSLLSRKYKELGDNIKDKKQFLTDYADAIENTGIEIKDLNDAEDVFITNTDKYIESLKKKAKAQGAYNLLVKETEKYLEERAKLEAKLADKVSRLPETTPEGYTSLGIDKLKRKLAELDANYNKKTEYYSNYNKKREALKAF